MAERALIFGELRTVDRAEVRFVASGFGLCAAAIGAWLLQSYLSGPEYNSSHSPWSIVIGGYMFAVTGMAGLLTTGIMAINRCDRHAARWSAANVGACGVWFIPALLLPILGPWAALAGGIVAAVAVTICLRPCVDTTAPVTPTRGPAGVVATTTFLHAALFAALIGKTWIGVSLAALGCFALAWQSSIGGWAGAGQPEGSRGVKRLAVNFSAAWLLVIPILVVSKNGNVSGFGQTENGARDSQRELPGDPRYRHSGVVLRSEKPHYVLIAPVPRHRPVAPGATSKATPFSIPFSGDYWFYTPGFARWNGKSIPRWRPPDEALVETGSPLKWNLSLPDARSPLVMKAHQPLSILLDLSCCSAVEVTIENAQAFAPSTLIELSFIDSRLKPGPAQIAGSVAVPKGVSTATLRFAVPDRMRDRQADALDLLFVVGPMYRDRSLNIAVREFKFIPR